MENVYSTQKIIYHPDRLAVIKSGEQTYPLVMHLMPTNLCNLNCEWCAYRVANSKNTQMFDENSNIPPEILAKTIKDFKSMGGKAVEVTGGGEPLVYKHKKELFRLLQENDLDYSLITNGTVGNEELVKLIVTRMSWARVSIDAGTPETFSKIKNCNASYFYKSLNFISLLRKYGYHPEFRLGLGFVISNENVNEVYEACRLAKEYGADNIRIATVFHPESIYYFSEDTVKIGREETERCKELEDDSFKVYNIFHERIDNILKGEQDYQYCATKDLICLIGADCKVYTCCTLAYNKLGQIGDLREQSLKELYDSEKCKKWMKEFDPRKRCKLMCLYESRNRFINNIVLKDPIHKNFY